MIVRAQVAFQYDSALPKDFFVITPHFVTGDPTALGNALVTNLKANATVGTKPFTVTLYDAQHAAPNLPLFTGAQTGSPPSSNLPREVALCLSYYSTYNRPTYRGRLYLPGPLIATSAGSRPSSLNRTSVASFADTFGHNLPAASNWVVYSRTKNLSYGVTDWWVDDEWDTVRSRGLKATTRTVGKV